MKVRLFLIFSILLNCIVFYAQQKQNFVFILVDDLGWNDLGYAGSTFHETPHIDALSQNSLQFENAYASGSVCSPTRASIMTGKHPVSVNITDWLKGNDPKNKKLLGPQDLNELPLSEITLPEVLKQAGYQTIFVGKWHLGGEGFFPEDQGFNGNIAGHHMGHPPGGYYSPYNNPKLSDGPDGEYLTDRLTDESIQFLGEINDQPFLLFLSYYTVHTPIQANKKHIDKFISKADTMGLDTVFSIIDKNGRTVQNQANPAYASMLYALDENIGKLITQLKEKNLYDNTTIIFTSDNGGLSTYDQKYNRNAPTSVLPLRGGKGWLFEGGIRIPLLIKPAHFKDGSRRIKDFTISHDLYPTLLAMANISIPKEQEVDGLDISPILFGEDALDREELFWHYPHYHGSGWTPGAAIRQGDWKLIELYEDNEIELYNLKLDPGELNDLSGIEVGKAAELRKRLHQLQRSKNALLPIENPEFNK